MSENQKVANEMHSLFETTKEKLKYTEGYVAAEFNIVLHKLHEMFTYLAGEKEVVKVEDEVKAEEVKVEDSVEGKTP